VQAEVDGEKQAFVFVWTEERKAAAGEGMTRRPYGWVEVA